MDLIYLRDRLHEELTDACEYAKVGIELKPMSSDWSKTYMSISSQELQHAYEFYRLYTEYVDKLTDAYPEKPKYVTEIEKDVNGFYTDMVVKVKMLHDVYK